MHKLPATIAGARASNGGAAGHGMNKESSGRASGYPGKRSRSKIGSRTDVEFPTESEEAPKE